METLRDTGAGERRGGEGSGRPRPTRSRPRARPPWWGPALTLIGLVLLCAAVLVGLRVVRAGETLPGLTVAGADVGGLTADELTAALAEIDQARRARQIITVRGTDQVESSAAELGYSMDLAATAEAAMARGRQANPLLAFRDQVRASFRGAAIAPVESFDGTRFAEWVARIAEDLSLPPIQGDIILVGTQVQVVEPEPGLTIDVEELRARALASLDGSGSVRIEVPTVTATPETTPEELAALADLAERAVSGPVTLTRGDVTLQFTPEQIAGLLTVVEAAAGLELAVDPDRLLATLPAEQFAGLSVEPQDATIEASEGVVTIVPSVDGFTFDAPSAADQLLEVATGTGSRLAELEGEVVEADFTTADAQALGITERVSTFTTQHPCCQSRVTNIQRMADLVDGTIVEPGETFSLNDHVGERTVDKGFVGGGAISGGEFVEQIGGGVSQFTTTMFNTIFFGGYEIVTFKPHSYYISRYPEGREATLNFSPPVDLRFTNDSPHGIYIASSYTDTSITVSFYSTTFAEVSTTTGPRYGFREPEEQVERTDDLPAGEERVVQSGRQGFSVDFTRVIAYVDGSTVTENYTTTYLAEPRITQVGTGDPAQAEEPEEGPTEPAEEPEAAPPAEPPPADPPAPAPAEPEPAAPPTTEAG